MRARSHFCSNCSGKVKMVQAPAEWEERINRLEEGVAELETTVSQIRDLRADIREMRAEILDMFEQMNGIEMMVNQLRQWTWWLTRVYCWWYSEAVPR
jgi:uncharacterized coiled-coil DUF342 family protein